MSSIDPAMYMRWVGRPVSDKFISFAKCKGVNITYKKGTTIVNEGDFLQHMYYIDKGWVAVYLNNSNGDLRIVRLASARETFGIGPAMDHIPFPLSIKVIDECEIYKVSCSELIKKMSEDADLSMEVVSIVNSITRILSGYVLLFSSSYSPKEKLINLFSSLLFKFGDKKKPSDWYELPISLSHTQIGQIIGVSRITVYRIFKDYKAQDKIKIINNKQFIHNELLESLYLMEKH